MGVEVTIWENGQGVWSWWREISDGGNGQWGAEWGVSRMVSATARGGFSPGGL